MRSADLDRGAHALVLVRAACARRRRRGRGRARRRPRGAPRRRRPGRPPCARRPRGGRQDSRRDRVLGDHDPHGIATGHASRSRAGSRSPTSLHAQRRGLAPARPEPRRTTAPPTPSSATVTCSVPLSCTARTVTFDGDPCLTAFVSASHATKYAAASTLPRARRSRRRRREPERSSRGRAGPRQGRRRAGPAERRLLSGGGRRSPHPPRRRSGRARARGSGRRRGRLSWSRLTCTPSETRRCCAPSCRSRSSRRRSS